MEIVITAILGVVATVFAAFIWEKCLRDRVSIKRIKTTKDREIEPLIILYEQLFPDDGVNYSGEELLELIGHQNHSKDVSPNTSEDFMLVAKCRGDVIGFLFCHYYPERAKAIISYFAIDKSIKEARTVAARTLLKSINTQLTRNGRQCNFLFFDVERPANNLPRKIRAERKSRITLFKHSAATFQKKAYCIDFDYKSPRITMSPGTREVALTLMVIPLAENKQKALKTIPKEQLLEFIHFIYFDCYGDIYELGDPRLTKHQEHMTRKLSRYEKSLPPNIALT